MFVSVVEAFARGFLLSLVGAVACCYGGGFSRSTACTTCVKAAPVIRYAAPVVAPYYYQVGAQLQAQSSATHAFRNSAEWSEFLQLRGYKAGVESMLAVEHARAAQPEAATGEPAGGLAELEARAEAAAEEVRRRRQPVPAQPQAPPENEIPPAEPMPPGNGPPPATPPMDQNPFPVLTQACAKCHTGTEPKGDLWLDGSVDLRGPDAAETRDKIVRALWLGHMPPDTPADDATVGQILTEIYVE